MGPLAFISVLFDGPRGTMGPTTPAESSTSSGEALSAIAPPESEPGNSIVSAASPRTEAIAPRPPARQVIARRGRALAAQRPRCSRMHAPAPMAGAHSD